MLKEKGEFFGELSLLYSVPRIANVEVMSLCDIYLLHAEDYEKVCGMEQVGWTFASATVLIVGR